eukprot:gene1706-1058_t
MSTSHSNCIAAAGEIGETLQDAQSAVLRGEEMLLAMPAEVSAPWRAVQHQQEKASLLLRKAVQQAYHALESMSARHAAAMEAVALREKTAESVKTSMRAFFSSQAEVLATELEHFQRMLCEEQQRSHHRLALCFQQFDGRRRRQTLRHCFMRWRQRVAQRDQREVAPGLAGRALAPPAAAAAASPACQQDLCKAASSLKAHFSRLRRAYVRERHRAVRRRRQCQRAVLAVEAELFLAARREALNGSLWRWLNDCCAAHQQRLCDIANEFLWQHQQLYAEAVATIAAGGPPSRAPPSPTSNTAWIPNKWSAPATDLVLRRCFYQWQAVALRRARRTADERLLEQQQKVVLLETAATACSASNRLQQLQWAEQMARATHALRYQSWWATIAERRAALLNAHAAAVAQDRSALAVVCQQWETHCSERALAGRHARVVAAQALADARTSALRHHCFLRWAAAVATAKAHSAVRIAVDAAGAKIECAAAWAAESLTFACRHAEVQRLQWARQDSRRVAVETSLVRRSEAEVAAATARACLLRWRHRAWRRVVERDALRCRFDSWIAASQTLLERHRSEKLKRLLESVLALFASIRRSDMERVAAASDDCQRLALREQQRTLDAAQHQRALSAAGRALRARDAALRAMDAHLAWATQGMLEMLRSAAVSWLYHGQRQADTFATAVLQLPMCRWVCTRQVLQRRIRSPAADRSPSAMSLARADGLAALLHEGLQPAAANLSRRFVEWAAAAAGGAAHAGEAKAALWFEASHQLQQCDAYAQTEPQTVGGDHHPRHSPQELGPRSVEEVGEAAARASSPRAAASPSREVLTIRCAGCAAQEAAVALRLQQLQRACAVVFQQRAALWRAVSGQLQETEAHQRFRIECLFGQERLALLNELDAGRHAILQRWAATRVAAMESRYEEQRLEAHRWRCDADRRQAAEVPFTSAGVREASRAARQLEAMEKRLEAAGKRCAAAIAQKHRSAAETARVLRRLPQLSGWLDACEALAAALQQRKLSWFTHSTTAIWRQQTVAAQQQQEPEPPALVRSSGRVENLVTAVPCEASRAPADALAVSVVSRGVQHGAAAPDEAESGAAVACRLLEYSARLNRHQTWAAQRRQAAEEWSAKLAFIETQSAHLCRLVKAAGDDGWASSQFERYFSRVQWLLVAAGYTRAFVRCVERCVWEFNIAIASDALSIFNTIVVVYQPFSLAHVHAEVSAQLASSLSVGMSTAPADGAEAEPLTKAKLFVASPDGSWVEIGTGVVELEPVSDALQLLVTSLPLGECLMRTSITSTCVYNTHEETTLLWLDPEIARDIALSFNAAEGCELILAGIRAFQSRHSLSGCSSNVAEALWAVSRDNLQHILEAARTDTYNFGAYLRTNHHYWGELAALFHKSREAGDEEGAALLGEITLALLRSPYTTDRTILAQFVDSVNDCIDMVQYGLGRRSPESGFLSTADRQAAFRNPCSFDDSVLQRIHLLYACNYLRDLLPLSLDDTDQMTPSPLLENLEDFQNQLVEQICASPVYLPRVFQRHTSATGDIPFDLVNFVLDLSKTIKTARIDLDAKAARYQQLFDANLLPFLTSVLQRCLRSVEAAGADGSLPAAAALAHDTSRAIQSVTETLTHAINFFIPAFALLAGEASNCPDVCTLSLVMRCVLACSRAAVQHAVYDFVSSVFLQPLAEPHRKNILLFWAADRGAAPPLRCILARVAALLTEIVEGSTGLIEGYQQRAVVASYCLKIAKLFVESGDQSAVPRLWGHLRDTQVLVAIARFINVDAHACANLQSSAVSMVACLIKNGDPSVIIPLCAEAAIIDAAVEAFLRRSRRRSIFTSSLASLLAAVAAAAKEYSAGAVFPPLGVGGPGMLGAMGGRLLTPASFITGDNSNTFDAHVGADNPFKASLQSLLQRYGERLRTASPAVHTQLCTALNAATDTTLERSSSFPSTTLDGATSSPDLSPVRDIPQADEAEAETMPPRTPGAKSSSEEVHRDGGGAAKSLKREGVECGGGEEEERSFSLCLFLQQGQMRSNMVGWQPLCLPHPLVPEHLKFLNPNLFYFLTHSPFAMLSKRQSTTAPSSFHFQTLQELCRGLGATKLIRRLLVANNGLAAVKGIDSIKAWLYEHCGDADAIHHVVMATPEDLTANAEFISISDQHVPVPGGPNVNNYANVDIIMRSATQLSCDAIYPGWGHASENPALPRECDRSAHITFLGPTEDAMFALGDKIASTIVAQSNGVPTVPWSGESIILRPGVFDVSPSDYEKAYITSVEECVEACRSIGFPVMIKASEGGGGKGIRCCSSLDQVKDMFFAVAAEVKGCHIFAMRMLENVRHLEVQLLADNYGNCIAVRTRDCSVQRRHQKIIEEGPAFEVDPKIIAEMEGAAIRLAKAVCYRGLGTVEYMYDKATSKFYFLELNPRIQVEHPVSEMISGINLPAALLCVGMGIRLDRIPEVRVFYGEEPYESTEIDFENRTPVEPKGHVIAVRITAEDTDEGFRPSSGKVEEILFKNSKECWGYFSISSGGSIHQFADSQFGHIFSSGATREDARRGMVRALRNLIVRGEIRTSSAYVLDLLETPAFRDADVSTAWLDKIIAKHSGGEPNKESIFSALASACIFRNLYYRRSILERYVSFLAAGHVPSSELLSNYRCEPYVRNTDKYVVSCSLISENQFALGLNNSTLVVPFRALKSGALQLTIAEKTVVAYVAEEPSSLRITIGGKTTNFTSGVDPTKVTATVPGRLVRYVIEDGGHITEGGTFAEVEVMKMILPIRVTVAGKLHHRSVAGSTVSVGVLLAEITPDDPSKVSRPNIITDTWPSNFLETRFERPDGVTRARRAIQALQNLLAGFHFQDIPMETRLQQALNDLSALTISSVTLQALNLPYASDSGAVTPTEKQRAVIGGLLQQYIDVESAFHARNREEAIAFLRDSSMPSEQIFAVDFAHHQRVHHDTAISILHYLERNHTVLKLLETELARLSNLKSHAPGSLALNAKYLLRQAKMPSVMERKAQFAKELELGVMSELVSSSYGYDLMCSIMFDRQYTHLVQVCMEMYIRRECLGEGEISTLDIFPLDNCWFSVYTYEALAVDPDKTLNNSGEEEDSVRTAIGGGACIVFMDEQRFRSAFTQAFEEALIHCAAEVSFVTLLFSVSRDYTQSKVAQLITEVIQENRAALVSYRGLRCMHFMVYGMPDGPHMFTFKIMGTDYAEDTLLRNVRQQLTRRLELDRLSNFVVEMHPTPYKEVHLFKATPRKAKPGPFESRIFARVVVTANDMNMKPWTVATEVDVGHMLTKCTAALEVARDDMGNAYPRSNHIFVKMVEITFDVSTLQDLLTATAATFGDRLVALGITEVELSFQAKVKSGFIQMRVMVDSPSFYSMDSHVYYETIIGSELYLYRAEFSEDVSTTDESLVIDCHSPLVPQGHISHKRSQSKLEALRELLPSKCLTDSGMLSPLEGQEFPTHSPKIPFEPYPHLSEKAIKRLQAHENKTSYVDDWPHLFELVILNEWANLCYNYGLPKEAMPSKRFVATPLYCSKKNVRAVTMNETHGIPHRGMVAWRISYFPASYYDLTSGTPVSRSFVLVANDITHVLGSFAVPEDELFKAASSYARQERVPFIYASSNSGARIGLSEEVKRRFKVEFSPNGELQYIYLSEKDYEELCVKKIDMEVEKKITESGDTHYVLLGVVGSENEYLGVENLSGASLIAGEMSKSYSEIPTLSIVSGRSIGIGAYLNRLGRRIIQTGDSTIILTGFKALNRLLGKDVYLDNSQLGGKKIMVPNGTTHFSTKHDYASVKAALRWLNFVPPVCDLQRCTPRVLTLAQPDPVDRDVTYTPVPDTPYDPRNLVRGTTDATGMFDAGSWMETMEGWAKTVVAGRATLGGIPCGVILVETRHVKKHNPADPADPSSTSSFIVQAGQVWYSDSARKTAEAIEDFHHERLPCFIIANWRGFSGGMRDMYDEVLKFGSTIVDNLRVYTAPVFVYLPPYGELRGGAWVVIEPVINENGVVEMYCDPTSRGGVLEASGIAEIKFRAEDVRRLMRRCMPELEAMEPAEAKKREEAFFSRYQDAGVRFADLHDTHFRMTRRSSMRAAVPWVNSRRVFYWMLVRKLQELQLVNDFIAAGEAADLQSGFALLERRYTAARGTQGTTDEDKISWLQEQLQQGKDKKPSQSDYFLSHVTPKRTADVSVLKVLHSAQASMQRGDGVEECLAEMPSKQRKRSSTYKKAFQSCAVVPANESLLMVPLDLEVFRSLFASVPYLKLLHRVCVCVSVSGSPTLYIYIYIFIITLSFLYPEAFPFCERTLRVSPLPLTGCVTSTRSIPSGSIPRDQTRTLLPLCFFFFFVVVCLFVFPFFFSSAANLQLQSSPPLSSVPNSKRAMLDSHESDGCMLHTQGSTNQAVA